MKLLDKYRHPVVLPFMLIMVLGLVTEGGGFTIAASLIFKQLAKITGSLAGHTWNVVSFKLVESGWTGLLSVIFPPEDKVRETMREILDRFDQVENLVRTNF
jgi:predicted DNA-binding transcriptional regulator